MALKRINVLIPNATSPKNPGDQAILSVLIGLVKKVHPNALITVHTTDPHLYAKKTNVLIKHTLYSWSVFEDRSVITRCLRVSAVMAQYFLLRMGINYQNSNDQLSDLVHDYKNADLILFVGGGYLHAKTGIKQSLNLFMQLFIFKFATLFPAKKIAGPISIGPFAYNWQEKAVVQELNKMDTLAIRENFSLSMLKKYALKNSVLSPDHALMTKKKQKKKKKHQNLTVGFTLRQWLHGEKQLKLEASVLSALIQFVKLTGARIQPILQVDAPEYGENDISITKTITSQLKNKNIEVMPVAKIRTVDDAQGVYSDIDLLLGMRMHSNILAATQGTPFVAISYEHKTQGIANQLGMKKYCISCEAITGKHLYSLMKDAYTNRKYLSKQLERNIKSISIQEVKDWDRYLSL